MVFCYVFLLSLFFFFFSSTLFFTFSLLFSCSYSSLSSFCFKKVNFCCSITSPTHQSDLECDRLTGDKVLRQIRKLMCNWKKLWEQEAVQSPLCMDSCSPRLRSRRSGGSRAGALDPEFDAEEDVARENVFSERPLMGDKPVCTGSDPTATGHRLALNSVSFVVGTTRACMKNHSRHEHHHRPPLFFLIIIVIISGSKQMQLVCLCRLTLFHQSGVDTHSTDM